MLTMLLAVFVGSLIVSFATVPIILRVAPQVGLIDHPGHRKVHEQSTPMGGGIAIWMGVAVPACTLLLLCIANPTAAKSAVVFLSDSIALTPGRASQLLAIAIGGTVLFVVGLVDDRWDLSWKIRLGLQLAVASGVAVAGVRATVFVSQPWFGFVVTVLWIMVLTNAMNFLDNMDALSAGIGLVASLVFVAILIVMVRTTAWGVAVALLMLAGSLSGFLIWNRPPAALFMGDSGSNLVGFLLATLTVIGTFYESGGARHVILAPVCVLAVPLYDFCTVIWIRLRQGRSPFHGDKSHFSHRLVELGFRQSRAVLTIHLATLMTGIGGLLLYKVSDWTGALLVMALILCVLAVIALLETVGRRSVNEIQDSLQEAQALAGPKTVEQDVSQRLDVVSRTSPQ
jgi:UDP-GlcNAc:undecaprenyl-phosphate/decaprenyl-phosphate GlcNAc-1-phosphate transferase